MAHPMALTDVRERLREAGELAIQAAESSAEFRQDLAAIGKWWSAAHPEPERLLAILYLRAQEHVSFGKDITRKDLEKRANRARVLLQSTERNALQNLATELNSRIRRSMFLSRRLAVAQEELAELAPDMEQIALELVPILRQHGVWTVEPSADMTATVAIVLLVILL